jgi:hypothetical protein
VGTLGVDTDGLYDPVDPDVARQFHDSPYRFLLVEVDHLGALRAGHLQA